MFLTIHVKNAVLKLDEDREEKKGGRGGGGDGREVE